MEYTVFNRDKGGKVSAENVKLLRKGTIPPIPGKDEVLHGKVVRPLRSVNPDQNDYCGLIQVKNEDGSGKKHFTLCSSHWQICPRFIPKFCNLRLQPLSIFGFFSSSRGQLPSVFLAHFHSYYCCLYLLSFLKMVRG